jgi:hypothetical protein
MSETWTETQSDTRRRVFISYSHEPPENAEFVRDLAGRLRLADFDVWLDEERIPGAADIEDELRKAIRESEIGLFIATARWVKREWTRFEVKLFGLREDSRRLVVMREEVDLGDLGPHLIGLKNVRWPPGDEGRDARFWEIYCGINNLPPGPRQFWEREGRRVASRHTSTAESAQEHAPEPEPAPRPGLRGRVSLPCAGRPVASVVGEKWAFVVTDQEEWVGVAPDGTLHPVLPRLSAHSTAAFGVGQELLVGLYEPMLVRLRGEHWEYLPQEAPVLCFGSVPGGNVAGTAAGGLVLIEDSPPVPFTRIRDPVAALASFEGGLVVLGSRGRFGSVLWPVESKDELAWVNTDALGRPVGLFGAVRYNHVGVHSATRLGILDPVTGQLDVCEHAVAQGIREVFFLGARSRPYAVLTEAGGLLLADAALINLRPVRLPRASYISGCCQAESGSRFHVWTSDGELYTITDEAVESTASDGVVLTYYPNPSDKALHVIRWGAGTGATLERLMSQ